jgi:hypothetical protein
MIGIISKLDALVSLAPTSKWSITDDVVNWYDEVDTEPTDFELVTEVTRLQAEYDAQTYARSRKTEYPTIEECVHAILDDDLTALQVLRQAVKDKYPKE